MLPFWASVGLWYVFNLLCLCWGVHALARALEETMLAMQKAQIGFQAALQVRSRLVQTYSEIMNMTV